MFSILFQEWNQRSLGDATARTIGLRDIVAAGAIEPAR
jgi:hypothetical protein